MTRIEWLVAFGDRTWTLIETIVNDHELGEPSKLEEDALIAAANRFPDREIALVAVYCHHDMEEE